MRGARLVSPRRAVKGLYPNTYNPTFYSAVQSSLRRSSNEDVPISRRLIEALDRQPTSNTTRPHIPTSVGHKRSKGKGSNSHKNSRATTWSPHGSSVGIFWDMENVTISSSRLLDGIQIIQKTVAQYGFVRTFKSYKQIPLTETHTRVHSPPAGTTLDDLMRAGVDFCGCPSAGRKDVVDSIMMQDMLTFALDNPAGTIVLVSGDGDFTRVLSLLRQRNFSTVVIYPPNHSTSLLNYAVRAHDWDQLRGAGGLVDESTDEKKAVEATSNSTVVEAKGGPPVEPEPDPKSISPPSLSKRATKLAARSAHISSLPAKTFKPLVNLLLAYVKVRPGGLWMNIKKIPPLLRLLDPFSERYLDTPTTRRAYFERAVELNQIVLSGEQEDGLFPFISLHPKNFPYPAPADIHKAAEEGMTMSIRENAAYQAQAIESAPDTQQPYLFDSEAQAPPVSPPPRPMPESSALDLQAVDNVEDLLNHTEAGIPNVQEQCTVSQEDQNMLEKDKKTVAKQDKETVAGGDRDITTERHWHSGTVVDEGSSAIYLENEGAMEEEGGQVSK